MRRFLAFILVVIFAASAGWTAAYWRHVKGDDETRAAKASALQAPASRRESSIVFFSVEGDVIASGSLSTEIPRSSAHVTGCYSLEMHPSVSKEPDVLWFHQLFDGKLEGKFEQTCDSNGVHFSYNFMPGIADGNVRAEVERSSIGLLDGRWTYETMAGGYQGGAVVVKDGKTSPNQALQHNAYDRVRPFNPCPLVRRG